MQIIVLADALQKEALLHGQAVGDVVFVEDVNAFHQYPAADAYLDLEYVNTPERNAALSSLLPKPVVINSVTHTLSEVNVEFVRINAWNTFLSNPIIEGAANIEGVKQKAEAVFALFQKQIKWLPDEPGFVTARVVSMVINEAFLALEEGVSTSDEIDTAMKLGTNYPYGPFEWAEKIGVQNIVTLLSKLGETQPRYMPSELFVQETNRGI